MAGSPTWGLEKIIGEGGWFTVTRSSSSAPLCSRGTFYASKPPAARLPACHSPRLRRKSPGSSRRGGGVERRRRLVGRAPERRLEQLGGFRQLRELVGRDCQRLVVRRQPRGQRDVRR